MAREKISITPASLHPDTKQEAQEVELVTEMIVEPKLSNFIINKETYKFVKLSIPFLYQMVAVKKVARKKMTEVIREKDSQAIRMYGSTKGMQLKKLGYINSFGVSGKF